MHSFRLHFGFLVFCVLLSNPLPHPICASRISEPEMKDVTKGNRVCFLGIKNVSLVDWHWHSSKHRFEFSDGFVIQIFLPKKMKMVLYEPEMCQNRIMTRKTKNEDKKWKTPNKINIKKSWKKIYAKSTHQKSYP